MHRQPLILSSMRHDIHAHAVCWGLRQAGLKPIWLLSPTDDSAPAQSLVCDDREPWRAHGWLDSERTGSVWYRRPSDPEPSAQAQASDRVFIGGEWSRTMRNLYALGERFCDQLWVNRPAAAMRAEHKLAQLDAARECGLRFPPTLISHDPDQIRRFTAEHGRVVYKTFTTHSWTTAARDRTCSVYATVLEPELLDDEASLALCPGIFQPYVDKVCDLRIVVIGERFFTVRVVSSSGGAFVDWRAHQFGPDLIAEPFDLPTAYQDKLRGLMNKLGLVFGCIDVVLDRDGEPHFLEINQAGQFLFVEDMAASLPLLRALCAMLAQGRADYDMESLPALPYQQYLDCDEHGEWWREVKPGLEVERGLPSSWLSIE